MVDLTATRAQAKGVTPTINREGGGGGEQGRQGLVFAWDSQNMAITAMLLDTLPPPSTNEGD
jgi:hypothetical protein